MAASEDASVASAGAAASESLFAIDATREREVFRYLEPWRNARQASILFEPISLTISETSPSLPDPAVSRGCDDTALSAFAQLGALRVRAQRCMILLFGRDHEFLLAESTRTLSLQMDAIHGSGDSLWLGTGTFSKNNGLGDHVLQKWHKTIKRHQPNTELDHYHTDGLTPHWFIVSDLRQRSDMLDRFFPKFNKSIRFMAAVPLFGSQHRVVGAYLVLDTLPRFGLAEEELVFMEDMADTVMNHLASRRGRVQKERAERLIKGLGVFSQGGNTLREWWLENRDMEHRRSRWQEREREEGEATLHQQADQEMGETFRMPGHESKGDRPKQTNGLTRSRFTQDSKSLTELVNESQASPSRSSTGNKGPGFDLKAATEDVFSRASNLIREAMDVDGVLFLDAGFVQSRASKKKASSASSLLSTRTTSRDSRSDYRASDLDEVDAGISSDSSHSSKRRRPRRHAVPNATCRPLGFSTKAASSLRSFPAPSNYGLLKQARMTKLLEKYPEGHHFNFSLDGSLLSSSGTETAVTDPSEAKAEIRTRETALLASVCDGARSIAFVPMWDSHRDKWRSGALIWTTAVGRSFQKGDDIPYLSAFLNCVAGELNKLDTIDSDQAKASFISCVSHELRSPLHGILAGSDLVLETDLTRYQSDMMLTVKTAGTTLLDTVNTILEYSMINSSAENGTVSPGAFDGVDPKDDREMDLAILTEEVINSIAAGRHHQASAKGLASFQLGGDALPSGSGEVQLLLQVIKQPSWRVHASPTSWVKIVTNLVENAIKFTSAGLVQVVLDRSDTTVVLTVHDTGIGMSPDFVEDHLFKPFRQENSLTPGMGLGLYLTKRSVDEIGGTISITGNTTQGLGTTAVVTLNLYALDADTNSTDDQTLGNLKLEDGGPIRICLIDNEMVAATTPDADHDRYVKLRILKGVERTCSEWLGLSLQRGAIDNLALDADVYLMLEVDLRRWVLRKNDDNRVKPKIILIAEQLGAGAQDRTSWSSSVDAIIFGPFGPRSIAKAITAAVQDPGGTPRAGQRRMSLSRGDSSPTPASGAIPQRPGPPSRFNSTLPTWVRSKKLLLVEDNEINMMLLVAWADRLKMQYEKAGNGLEAIKAYKASPASFCLVLMDISMPVMDGFAAAQGIRKYEAQERLRRCRIVALTGVASADARANAKSSGIDLFVAKPASLKYLKELVEDL